MRYHHYSEESPALPSWTRIRVRTAGALLLALLSLSLVSFRATAPCRAQAAPSPAAPAPAPTPPTAPGAAALPLPKPTAAASNPVSSPAPGSSPVPSPVSNPMGDVRRTVYPNGLVLLSKEDHAAPVVSVWVYYRVGSRDEVQGIFGISHQVEHMMFKGTHYLHPGDIDRLFSERGGENNAMTTQDYTAYNETLPSSALDVALRVEADRMEHSAMLPSELAHEKTVVLSEIEGDLNSPLYRLDTAVTAAAFQAHPYHIPVGGFPDDIRRYTRAEVQHYYSTHYAANNAVLVVVGDFNTDALRRLVAADFRVDPPKEVGDHTITAEPPQEGERRVNVVGVGDTPYVEIAYHVAKTGDRGHYLMDVISTILGSGRSSRLYRSLVEQGLATEVDAGDPDMKDPFLMTITATVARGHTQAQVEQAIEAELERLKTERVSQEELQKTINQVKASFVYRNDRATSQAGDIGMYASIGYPRYLETYLSQIQSIVPAEIQAEAISAFAPENRTVGWFIPRALRPGELPPSSARAGGLHYKPVPPEVRGPGPKPSAGRLEPRSTPPTPVRTLMARRHRRRRSPRTESTQAGLGPLPDILQAPAPPRGHPEAVRTVLSNGMVVIVYPNHANADVSIAGSIRAGALEDPPGKAGLASFVAAMVNRGTQSRSEDQIATALDFVGASASVTGGETFTHFDGHCLTENLPQVLDILSDELRRPSFNDRVFGRVRNEIETDIQAGSEDPGTVAEQQFFAALYPESSPLHWPVIGTAETIPRIEVADLREYHERYYRPDLCVISIVGDVEPQAAVAMAQQYFGSWTAAGPTPSLQPPANPAPGAARRVVHTMPDKSEEVAVMGFPGIDRKDPWYYPAYLMNLVFGNSDFNSRLMKDIRDRRGLVYYVGSSWDAGLLSGPWILQMEANPADVDRAANAVTLDMIQMQKAGATPHELKLFKSWVAGNQALQLETSAGIADLLLEAENYGLGLNYIWDYPTIINAVSAAQVQEAARRLLHPESLVTSIAGPATH